MRALSLFALTLLVSGCAASPSSAPQLSPSLAVANRAATDTTVAIPPGIGIDDGLTADEAVAIALWNSADFRVQLTDLGFARADLLEAGLLKNPVLSLLFPLGPTQLEATLRMPIEVLWERPHRVAAANLALNKVSAGLEQYGLNVIAEVKVAYADLALARDRAALASAAATQLEEMRRITESRLRAGDISELEARSATIDAARARQDAERAEFDATLRANTLRGRLGLAAHPAGVTLALQPAGAVVPDSCGERPGLLDALTKDALAARPEVRAAEIAVEAAGARLGWEKARIITLTAVLDANGAGREGFEMGPGIDAAIPIFDRNQGNRARAEVELQRASLAYVAVRQRVSTELTEALTLAAQARGTLATWQRTVVLPLEDQVRTAERALAAGDVSYLFVLDMTRRLTDARLRAREIEADLARANARIERAVGRPCAARGQNGL